MSAFPLTLELRKSCYISISKKISFNIETNLDRETFFLKKIHPEECFSKDAVDVIKNIMLV